MAHFNCVVAAVFLVSVVFLEYAEGKASLTPFGKKAQSKISKDTYDKVFAVNAESADQLLKGLQKATDKFDEILGSSIDESLQKQLADEGKRLGLDGVSPSLFFHVYANALAKTLKKNGKLSSDNVEDAAQKWVDELDKSAKSLDSTNILSTFPAMTAANARLLKSFGLTSKENVNQFAQNLINEIDKY